MTNPQLMSIQWACSVSQVSPGCDGTPRRAISHICQRHGLIASVKFYFYCRNSEGWGCSHTLTGLDENSWSLRCQQSFILRCSFQRPDSALLLKHNRNPQNSWSWGNSETCLISVFEQQLELQQKHDCCRKTGRQIWTLKMKDGHATKQQKNMYIYILKM